MFVSRQNDLRLPLKKADFLALLQNVFSISLPMLEVYSSHWYQTVLMKLAVSAVDKYRCDGVHQTTIGKNVISVADTKCALRRNAWGPLWGHLFFSINPRQISYEENIFFVLNDEISPALWGSLIRNFYIYHFRDNTIKHLCSHRYRA